MKTRPPTPAADAGSRRAHRGQRGMTLIEVLVAVVLFSFGLIGLVALQGRAVQHQMSAEDSNRAALLANEIVATMWVSGTVTLPAAVVTDWSNRVADTANGGLPNGQGTVAVAGDVATVTVTWRPPGADSGVQHRYQTQALLP
ncbi:MAG: prepilin-type N-terminal cleavage/methylation domain-containing protein [Rubrivivax sp.]|nr:prepilin-type N-terminal cleavage/methylation domain-containing protein [Rubrivivax sp.]